MQITAIISLTLATRQGLSNALMCQDQRLEVCQHVVARLFSAFIPTFK